MIKGRRKKPARKQPTKATKDAVLREFNHRCAFCGADKPQLHHIDEDRSVSDPDNLIPLCPNCHLSDQHDATNAIPITRLRFFRKHKHRLILAPQFRPVFRRMSFLYELENLSTDMIEAAGIELAFFVQELKMGQFFSQRLSAMLANAYEQRGIAVIDGHAMVDENATEEGRRRLYLADLADRRDEVENLIVEQLDFQNWRGRKRVDGMDHD